MNLPDMSKIKGLASNLLTNVKLHPYKTGALVALGAGNLGGLVDNDKFGGQLGGAALSGLGAYALGFNPYSTALLALGGGELGSLFDKLRAKKDAEQQQVSQYYGGGR